MSYKCHLSFLNKNELVATQLVPRSGGSAKSINILARLEHQDIKFYSIFRKNESNVSTDQGEGFVTGILLKCFQSVLITVLTSFMRSKEPVNCQLYGDVLCLRPLTTLALTKEKMNWLHFLLYKSHLFFNTRASWRQLS